LDNNGYQVAPGYAYNPSPISLLPQNAYYTAVNNISDRTINNFLTDIGTPIPLLQSWNLNPRIQLTYVYLTDDERLHFSSDPLQYLVRQITQYSFQGLTSRQFALLDVHNPIERLIILPQRSDSVQYRNQQLNLTNWINPTKPPFLSSGGGWNANVNLTSATGQQVQYGQQGILQTLSILGDGNLLQEEKPIEYYTQVVPWKYVDGVPDTGLIVYPFSLTSPNTQPHGSINSSRIKTLQIDLNVYPLSVASFYQYNVDIYVESLNWVTIASGMGGLKYAL
jgi:hypothetical protein